MFIQRMAKAGRRAAIGLVALAVPLAAQAELLYTHYFSNSDVEPLNFQLSPSTPSDVLQLEFYLGAPGSAESTGKVSLQQGLTTINFSGALLQAMRQKSADGVINPGVAADRWGLDLLFLSGGGIGSGGTMPEAYDVQNPDTPQQTEFDPAYLAALTGADIQAIRLVVKDACFDGQNYPMVCNDPNGFDAGFVGQLYLEFNGVRRENIPEPETLPLLGALVVAGVLARGRRFRSLLSRRA